MLPPKQTQLALLCGAFLSIIAPLQAGPRFAQGEVTFQGTVQVTETSRVSPIASSSSDTIFAFIPAISYNRESNRMNLKANISAPMRRYETADYLDSDSLQMGISGELPFGNGPKLSGNWDINYFNGVQTSYLTNRNLETKTMGFNAYADYILQRKLSFRTRASYNDRSNAGVDSNFSNANSTTSFSAGLHVRDLIRGRIGTYVEYQIQKRKTDLGRINAGVDDTDDGINFGITGQILPEHLFPKLDADLSFGFTSSSGSDRNSSSVNQSRKKRLTLNGSLKYPASPKTNVALTYNRSLAITDDDRTVEQSNVNLSVSYTPRQKLSFSTSIGSQSSDFIYDENSRSDDALTASISARYSIRSHWSTSASYNYRDSSSNIAISDYNSAQLTLSTTLSY